MSMAPTKMKLRVTYPHQGMEPGSTIEVEELAPGIPADVFWRRRLKDGGAELVDAEESPAEEEVEAADAPEPAARKKRGSGKNS